MSIEEMKLTAIDEITKLTDEQDIAEILEHLSRLSGSKSEQSINLTQHYNSIKAKYSDVLKKLAE